MAESGPKLPSWGIARPGETGIRPAVGHHAADRDDAAEARRIDHCSPAA